MIEREGAIAERATSSSVRVIAYSYFVKTVNIQQLFSSCDILYIVPAQCTCTLVIAKHLGNENLSHLRNYLIRKSYEVLYCIYFNLLTKV